MLVATVLSAIGFIPVTLVYDSDEFSFWNLYGAALIGLAVTFLLVAITEYYTGTRWPPVKEIARASQTGHATNIISGLAVGMQATALPVIVIAAGVVGPTTRPVKRSTASASPSWRSCPSPVSSSLSTPTAR